MDSYPYDGGQSGSPVRREGLENLGQCLGELVTERLLQKALVELHCGNFAALEARGSSLELLLYTHDIFSLVQLARAFCVVAIWLVVLIVFRAFTALFNGQLMQTHTYQARIQI